MIPGSVSKFVEGVPVTSADTVTLRGGEFFIVKGTTTINTINPPLGKGQNQAIYLCPIDGAVILGITGNILAGVTITLNRPVMLMWVNRFQKWWIVS